MSSSIAIENLQTLVDRVRREGRGALGDLMAQVHRLGAEARAVSCDELAALCARDAATFARLAADEAAFATHADPLAEHLDRLLAFAAACRDAAEAGEAVQGIEAPAPFLLPGTDERAHFATTVALFARHGLEAVAQVEAILLGSARGAAPTSPSGALTRILQALAAEFDMLGIAGPQELCRRATRAIGVCAAADRAPPVDVLLQCTLLLRHHLAKLELDPRAPFEGAGPTSERLEQLAQSGNAAGVPRSTDGQGGSAALLAGGEFAGCLPEFVAESRAHLAAAAAAVEALAGDPDSVDHLRTAVRTAHAIKGGAGLLNLDALWDLAEALEVLLAGARDRRVRLDTAGIDLVRSVHDTIRRLLDSTAGGEPPTQHEVDHLVDRLEVASLRLPARHAATPGPASATPAAAAPTGAPQRVFLAVRLAAQEYAIPFERVVEVLGAAAVVPVPGAGDDVCGVVDLGRDIVPVVDLRQRLAVLSTEPPRRACIVVVRGHWAGGTGGLVGCLVDGAAGVLTVPASDVVPPPFGKATFGAVAGFVRRPGSVAVLLALDRLLAWADVPPELHDR